jgi:uncharacterized protein YjbI with pentapeptide repeats
MHTRDAFKNPKEFQTELECILSEAGDGIADFSRFVFPGPGCSGRQIAARCIFARALFTQDADFSQTTFAQDAEFFETTFTQGANFSYATFKGNVTFQNAEFTQNANFYGATFTQDAYFACARFMRDATFTDAKFAQKAHFPLATFGQYAGFTETTFAGTVDFRRARLAGIAHFRETKFRQDTQSKGREPSPLFSEAAFEEPESVTFYKTDLGRALFHNCDVSRMNFSDVSWRKRTNRKRMVFDEAVDVEHDAATLLPHEGDPNPRNYLLVAEIYQQLKKNYDDRRDYWTAGDFHYGEMEIKRLASDHHSRVLRWLHSNLGLVAWYKYASEYGESYVRPGCLLLAVLAVFSCFYPWAGLCNDQKAGKAYPGHCDDTELCVSYANWTDNGTTLTQRASAVSEVLGHGAMTALYVAAFQRDITYKPSYRKGRLLALVETLLTSTLGALFLLAVRRQFKR